ncbi:Ribonucleotide reductase small subunit [Lymphocystis disease virus 1]|uniref:Ribonucleotide reductase small subunit n=1 Tax=Fish lymphocystis disease virus TaxID=36363 RepID=UPI0000161EB6|nr:Ribonucleotide reductase small subunit [Lymphocystis disease virus 1]
MFTVTIFSSTECGDVFKEIFSMTQHLNPVIIHDLDHVNPLVYFNEIRIGTLNDVLQFKPGLKQHMFYCDTVFKPFHYSWAVEIRALHENIHWTEKELSLADDVSDWKTGKLTLFEKDFIIQILRLFTQLDVSVGHIYHNIFIPIFKNNELRNMLCSFACREGTHQQAYALLNDTLGLPETEYSTFLNYKEMTNKTIYMNDMKTDNLSEIALSLIKAVYNEGVVLFASFAMLLNFQRFGTMKGMGKVIEWSIRDENIHVEGLCKLFKTFISEYSFILTEEFFSAVRKIQAEVLQLETDFIILLFTNITEIKGLTKLCMINYVKYILQRRTEQLGLLESTEVLLTNPIDWISWLIAGRNITNFFENRVTEYDICSLEGDW